MIEKVHDINEVNEALVWQQIATELADNALTYTTVIRNNGLPIVLMIDVDPGSGFAGGYAFTTFSAPLSGTGDFKFGLHHQGFLDGVGKFFGMQDVPVGDAEFDEKVIVKTNDEAKVKALLASEEVREPWKNLRNFDLHISGSADEENGTSLKLLIEEALTNVEELRNLYKAFYKVAVQLNGPASAT